MERIKDNMIDKKTMRWVVGIIVGALITFSTTFGIYALTASAKAKDERKDNKQEIAVTKQIMNDGFQHLSEKLDDIQSSQKRIWRKLNHNE